MSRVSLVVLISGPRTSVSNGIFFLNTSVAIDALSRTISRFKLRRFVSVASDLFLGIQAQYLGPDSPELNGMVDRGRRLIYLDIRIFSSSTQYSKLRTSYNM